METKVNNKDKRQLKDDEIDNILNFIGPREGVPQEIINYEQHYLKQKLTKQLKNIKIYPDKIKTLKDKVIEQYYKSLVQPGTMVGVIAAQSIGEKQTQSTLNTFHKAGMAEQTVTVGVPRVKEIIDATVNQKSKMSTVYLKFDSSSIGDIVDVIRYKFKFLPFEKLYTSYKIHQNEATKPDWYPTFCLLHNKNLSIYDSNKSFIRFKIDPTVLYKSKLTLDFIVSRLEESLEDLIFAYSPFDHFTIDIYIESDIESTLFNTINPIHISGIPGIEDIFFTSDFTKITTKGSNMKGVCTLPFVDTEKTVSNDLWEIYNVLGVEAVYHYLVEELTDLMSGICLSHVKLLASFMTQKGTINAINRFTVMKNSSSGALARSTFEESLKHITTAAINTEVDPIRSISSSIFAAKKSRIGSGLVELQWKE